MKFRTPRERAEYQSNASTRPSGQEATMYTNTTTTENDSGQTDDSPDRLIHVRLVGEITNKNASYVATGHIQLSATNNDPAQIAGFIDHIVDGCITQWIGSVDEPGEIKSIEITLAPAYIDVLTPEHVEGVHELGKSADVTLRYSDTPADEVDQ